MKIHLISNSLRMNSGFSIVARHVANGLKKLGHDITFTGMQTAYVSDFNYGIEVLPAQTLHVDDITQTMLTINRIKPDVVLAIFQMDYEFNDFAKIFPKTCVYSPVEGRNVPQKMAGDLLSVKMNGGEIVAQCRYGQEEIQLALGGLTIPYIYHGYDPDIYKPLDLNNINSIRYCYYFTENGKLGSDPLLLHQQGCYDCKLSDKEQVKCPYYKEEHISILRFINGKWTEEDIPITGLPGVTKGKFIFGFIGQNLGVRKRIERLLKAYSLFIKDSRQLKDRTMIHLHTAPIAVNGVNLIKKIQDLGIQNNVIFSYGTYTSSAWTERAMAILYNTFDVNVSASSSEGFCILPDSPILTLGRGIQRIKDINVGDNVLTHKGRFRKVSQTMKREYSGDMIKIIPHKLRIPLVLTPEHRVLGIKTRLCESNTNSFSGGGERICKPGSCYYVKDGRQYKWCKYISGEEPWRKYKTEWIDARNLEKGDFVVYPKSDENEKDIEEIKIRDYIDDFLNVIGGEYDDNSKQKDLFGSFVEDTICMNASYSRKRAKIPGKVKLDGDLLRLFGYFIAEGDIAGERQIEFTFNINEIEYIEDAERIMKDKFGLDAEHIDNKTINGKKINVHTLRYSNTVLGNMFQNMFCPKEYETKKGKGSKSNIVRIPPEFLSLPLDKLRELIKGIWRGDGTKGTIGTHGYDFKITSETLAHQLTYILTKFNILTSLRISDSNSRKNEKWSRQYIVGILGNNVDIFDKIIGEKHRFRDVEYEVSRYMKGKNFYYVPIENIDIIRHNGDVWNLEVEEDNSYVSSVAIHNCLPILESMACGKPNIGPACSSFVELIGDGEKDPSARGLLASIGEWQMIENESERALVNECLLANQMKKLYNDDKLREKFGKNARQWVKPFNWVDICQQWDKLLKDMKDGK